MKKTYQSPATDVVKVDIIQNLLGGSPGAKTGSTLGGEYEESDVTYSRHRGGFSWDDEE